MNDKTHECPGCDDPICHKGNEAKPPQSVYDALQAAGHTDESIHAHVFACACTLTVVRNTGIPAVLAAPVVIGLTGKKLGVDAETAAIFVAAVVKTLQTDAEFAKAIEQAVTDFVE